MKFDVRQQHKKDNKNDMKYVVYANINLYLQDN
jgi:hypothetical protein